MIGLKRNPRNQENEKLDLSKTVKVLGWNDSRPCDEILLAQVRQARVQEEESQAIQLQGIAKLSSSKRIVAWSRLNTGEWEKMLGAPEEWMSEDQRRGEDLEYYDFVTGLPLEKQKVLLAREEQLVGLCKRIHDMAYVRHQRCPK